MEEQVENEKVIKNQSLASDSDANTSTVKTPAIEDNRPQAVLTEKLKNMAQSASSKTESVNEDYNVIDLLEDSDLLDDKKDAELLDDIEDLDLIDDIKDFDLLSDDEEYDLLDDSKDADLIKSVEDIGSSGNADDFDLLSDDEEYDLVDDATAETTNNGYALNPGLLADDKKLMAKHGDRMIEGVQKSVKLEKLVEKNVENLTDTNNPADKGKDIFDHTKETFKASTDNVPSLASLLGLAGPIKSGIVAILNALTKWQQWESYENAVFDKKDKDNKVEKPDAPAEAKYALTKIWKGFLRQIKEVIMSISIFVSRLLVLIPGAQIVAAGWTIFNNFIALVDSIYKGSKFIYQFFTGEKKKENSESLLNKAIDDKNTSSLELILNLKLDSIAGAKKADEEEHWYSPSDKTLDKISSTVADKKNKVKGFLGFNTTESGATRIIDFYEPGSGGPQNTEELHKMLIEVTKNPDSKKLILSEISKSMTGYGR